MASTYTVNIGIEKPGTGDQSGTWGVTTNTNFDIIDQATNGVATVTLAAAGTSGSPNTLLINNGALSDGRNRFIQFNDGADLGATAYVQLDPNDAEKIVHIRNSLSGSRSLILFQGTYNASNDFEVPNGADVLVKFDGGGTGATVTDVNVNLTPTKITTGDLDVDNININGNTISSTDTNGNINITPNGSGAVAFNTNATFGDNDKAIFGAGSDLQIYHDASNSYVQDAGTGNLYVQATNLILEANDGTNYLVGIDGTATRLHHPDATNGVKLATTATGVDVTGTVTADGLTVDGNATIVNNLGRLTLSDSDATNQKVFLDSNGGSAGITAQNNTSHGTIFLKRYNGTDTLITLGVSSNGDISFFADDGTTQGLYWDASTQRLGLGTTSPSSIFHTEENTTGTSIVRHKNTSNTSGAHSRMIIQNGGTSGGDALINLDTQASGSRFTLGVDRSASKFVIANADKGSFDGSNEAMVITSGGNVGIRTNAPSSTFQVGDGSADTRSTFNPNTAFAIGLKNGSNHGGFIGSGGANVIQFSSSAGAQRMTLDGSGNLHVGKTTSGIGTAGLSLRGDVDIAQFTRDGNPPLDLSRLTNDGDIVLFRKNSTTVGSIGTTLKGGVNGAYFGTGDTGLYYRAQSDAITPCTTAGGSDRDNAIDLGFSSIRFDDIYATNGTIQTSDQQEKNTITDSDLGLDFINRLSPKSYIFNGKTRTHYGLIAQDVETVLGDISKPTSGFAGFIKSDISDEQDGSEYRYGLRYTEFVGPLIQAIKDLKAENDAMRARLDALEAN